MDLGQHLGQLEDEQGEQLPLAHAGEQRRVNRLWAVARLEGRQFKRLLLAHAGELGVSIKQAL